MKYKKSITKLLVLSMVMTVLTGCAENQIPDRSPEEIQAIGEYVAFTLMKYDMGHTSRLMDLPPVEEEQGKDVPEQEEPNDTVGMDPVDDTPVINEAGNGQSNQTPQNQTYSMEEVMGLPEGVSVSFTGYEVYDSYPAGSDAFAVTAEEGKKLLVLNFSLTNTLDQEQSLDLLSSGTRYRILVDEENAQWSLPTMLPDDMSSYVGTMAAGETVEMVLLISMDAGAADAASSIRMILRNELKSYTIQLTGGAGD